jgi:hypothetical protein
LVHTLGVRLAAIPSAKDKIREHIARAKQYSHRVRRDRHLAVAHLIEHGLEKVCEGDERVQTKGAGATFDGVYGAEHGVHGLHRRVARLAIG